MSEHIQIVDRSYLGDLSRGALLISTSLLAAFLARLIRLRLTLTIRPEDDYLRFLSDSIDGFLPLVPVGVVAGALLCYFHRHWDSTLLKQSKQTRNLVTISALFALLFLAALTGGAGSGPNLEVLLWAWAFSVVGLEVLEITQPAPDRSRSLIYSRFSQTLIDATVVGLGFWFSYLIRFDGDVPAQYQKQFATFLPYIVVFYFFVIYVWGIHRFLWRFTGLREAIVIALAATSATFLLILLRVILLARHPSLTLPLGVLLIHPIVTYAGLMGVRALRRIQYRHELRRQQTSKVQGGERDRMLLLGAGQSGLMLVRDLEHNPRAEIVGFLDDDPRKTNRVIHGVRVLGTTDDLVSVLRQREVDKVVLCMPSAPRSMFRKVISRCKEMGVATLSIPSMSDMLQGKVSVSQLQPVRMEDLLRRDSVTYSEEDLQLLECYQGRCILITGAAGSIGSELVRQLREFDPSKLILLDKDENGLFEIGLEIQERFEGSLEQILADIRNRDRLLRVFEKSKPDVVFHAAAFKHVPMMELHPGEAILNNVFGSKNVIDLSCQFGVESLVMVSTDKAVNPTNVMGASKRVAELIVQSQAERHGGTRLCCVRFGNVLGSRGSVVPLFQKQISQGRDLTVTHPEVRRYFMSIPEAVQLIIQAGSLGNRGEVFVLDMGDPIRIVDLAQELVERSGLVLGKDIEIRFSGLRPGEKLCEELLVCKDNGIRHTRYPKIFVEQVSHAGINRLPAVLETLHEAAICDNSETIFRVLDDLDIGYHCESDTRHVTSPEDAS